ncbi:hypothetical protein SAMN04488118_11711 [Epibacterium ulvae]|uniref:Uncharacterized protein n=1 Tax=Epibacterium ulvae TaxID=1156985 RepID=A0A1G5RGV1_9RHOB|nr:hypothetical protein [Epibacterium ulvae]SCZ73372.1 hypothetical protein SAMN04488118_11711 [Epibacterium ulvae]
MRKQQDTPVTKHTVLIGGVADMWEKMYWDVDHFCDLQRTYPEEKQPLVFSAINACISSKSLEDWTKSAWMKAARSAGETPSGEDFQERLTAAIPIQDLCADIANTSKHASYRDSRHPDGHLNLKWDDGAEIQPACQMLLRSGDGSQVLLLSDLDKLPRQWWRFLRSLELVDGEQPTPVWLQKKLSRIFGGAD